jgi:divalent metal cation (Fe/Co/Zn/Cd) transporter
MVELSKEQAAGREKTLLTALLLSVWAPLATGIAVILSQSTTQVADFIRRTVELVALFVSWRVFRYLHRHSEPVTEAQKVRLERAAGLCVAAALACSGVVMLVLAAVRMRSFQPGGNVYPGLAIALLGLVVNVWFWRRYARLNREQYNTIIDAQRQLYRAKSLVDLCVIAALLAVALQPAHSLTRYIDIVGSVVVALYLVTCGAGTARTTLVNARYRDVSGEV